EHHHPAALEDAWAATRWMADEAPGPLFVGGDSAGGHLATCVAARARGTGMSVEGQLLIYPVTDLSRLDTQSYDQFAEGYWLTGAAMEWFRGHYLGKDGDPSDPDVSPLLRGDLSGMPPAVVIAADCDVLRDEGRAYADRLEAAGCQVDYRFYEGVIHGFFAMPGAIPEGRKAIQEAGSAIRELVGMSR
ncbi:MAG: alpha/beta hydrolase, partial [Longimicrobiales bacterium]